MIGGYFTFRWVCPECGDSVVVHKETDTSEWKMCGTCKAIRDAEKSAAEIQAELSKSYNTHPIHLDCQLYKPHYRYNWKTGKAELIKQ